MTRFSFKHQTLSITSSLPSLSNIWITIMMQIKKKKEKTNLWIEREDPRSVDKKLGEKRPTTKPVFPPPPFFPDSNLTSGRATDLTARRRDMTDAAWLKFRFTIRNFDSMRVFFSSSSFFFFFFKELRGHQRRGGMRRKTASVKQHRGRATL